MMQQYATYDISNTLISLPWISYGIFDIDSVCQIWSVVFNASLKRKKKKKKKPAKRNNMPLAKVNSDYIADYFRLQLFCNINLDTTYISIPQI